MRVATGNGIGEGKVAGAASARKILGALLCFTVEKPQWTVSELSAELSVALPTMYRYVALLRETGLLEPSGANAYRLSERVVGLAHAARKAGPDLAGVAMPVLEGIRDRVNETVLIAKRSGHHIYCVDRVESRQPVRLQFERGQPMALHRGSMARVLLAQMPADDRRRYLDAALPDKPEAERGLLSEARLNEVADVGYTQSFEEVDEGIWGTAAAIKVQGKTIASIGVAAPLYRLDGQMRDRITTEVRAGAAEISRRLGEAC